MAPECTFILSNGRKCRCAATRNQAFCRHHSPTSATAPQLAPDRPFSRLARWRSVGRDLPGMEADELPYEIYSILEALLEEDDLSISDRQAGRLLRSILRRIGSVPALPIPEIEPDTPTPQNARTHNQPSLPELIHQLGLDPKLLNRVPAY